MASRSPKNEELKKTTSKSTTRASKSTPRSKTTGVKSTATPKKQPAKKTTPKKKASPAPEPTGASPEMLAAMMEQMQALVNEVKELKTKVAETEANQAPENDPVSWEEKAEQFVQDMESEEESEAVSKEESDALLQGLSQIDDTETVAELEPDQEELVDQIVSQLDEKKPTGGVSMSQDDLDAILSNMDNEPEPEPQNESKEEVAEIEEEESSSDEDWSDDEIAKFIAENGGESRVAVNEALDEDTCSEVNDEEVTEPTQQALETSPQKPSSDLLSQDDITSLLAEAQSEAPETTPEPVAKESDNSIMSQDDIAAMLADAQSDAVQMNQEAPSDATEEDSGAMLSQDDIAAMMAEAQSESSKTTPEPVVEEEDSSTYDENSSADEGEEELQELSQEELMQLVSQTIADQDEANPPRSEESEEETPEGVLSANQLSALLETPDPEASDVPDSAEQMSADQLDALVAEADALNNNFETVQPAELKVDEPAEVNETQEAPQEKVVATQTPKKQSVQSGIDIGAVKLVPTWLAVRAMAVPVGFEEGKLVCRVAEPVDQKALDRIGKTVGMGIVVQPTPIAQVVQELREAYSEFDEGLARSAVIQRTGKKPLFKKGA